MNKVLLIVVAALSLTVAGLMAYVVIDGGSGAEANFPIECSQSLDNTTSPPTGTVTCTGEIQAGPQTIAFTLVVAFQDNPPAGPSFGDVIVSCSLNGLPVEVGPCPPSSPGPP